MPTIPHPDDLNDDEPEPREVLSTLFRILLNEWMATDDLRDDGEVIVEILEDPVYDDLVDEVRAAARLRRAASVSAPVPQTA